jgi:FemAB-related protein (PEP-CTERM system-associated)
MALTVATLDPRDAERCKSWERYVDAHPQGSGYHGLGWRRVIEGVTRYRMHYLCAEDGGAIVGILPLAEVRAPLFGGRLVSVPFTSYGGLRTDGDPAIGTALVDAAAGVARRVRARSVEFRHVAPVFAAPTRTHKVAMWLDLPSSEDALWKAFSTDLRTDIRRRLKSGLEVSVGGAEDLDDFYRVFSTTMRDLGTPTYSRAFFAAILREWPGTAWIATCRSGGAAVAGCLLLGFRGSIEVPWAGSLRSARTLRPNMLLFWACLRHAIEQGFTRFDFGRSTPGGGTFAFKKQWGSRAIPLHWQYWLADGHGAVADLSPANPKFAAAIRVWQRLPLWLTRKIGPPLTSCFP